MQLASRGARVVTRATTQHLGSKPGATSRSIHIPSFARAPLRASTSGATAQRLLSQTRNVLTRFVTLLTTPGTLRSPSAPSVARSLHGATRAQATIQSGLSFHVRTALSRPLQAPFLPRPPAVPCSTMQVGLGMARNFSSARPIFQNLVENVPITGRAFWAADWELQVAEERKKMQKPTKRKENQKGGTEMSKPKKPVLESVPEPVAEGPKDLDHYFPVSSAPEVVAYLLIPLAPTPTSRAPLPLSPLPASNPSLLPLPALASLHTDNNTHALRVSALFARLDAANVWGRGVTCSAYSHGREGGDVGVCTMLKVEFVGWTAGEVRGVIGESGSGWCVLEERMTKDARSSASSAIDDLSETSSVLSGTSDWGDGNAEIVTGAMEGMDPAQSFVLPTLDFSSSFLTAQPSPSVLSPSPSSTDLFAYNSDSDDNFSDSGSDFSSGSGSWIDTSPHHANTASDSGPGPGPGSTWLGFGFSSDFASRVGSEYEPREAVF
jgi:hypothetical protein